MWRGIGIGVLATLLALVIVLACATGNYATVFDVTLGLVVGAMLTSLALCDPR